MYNFDIGMRCTSNWKKRVERLTERMPSSRTDQQSWIAPQDHSLHWYAIRAFLNCTSMLMDEARELGYTTCYAVNTFESMDAGTLTYTDKPLIKNLFFVRCTQRQILDSVVKIPNI